MPARRCAGKTTLGPRIAKVVQLPIIRELRLATYPTWTNSSTLPSLVLTMLEALDVCP
ncbi:MAG: hypothetical protein ACRDSZ_21745 [Pseudonocardiaceae bacterium]